MVRHNNRMHSAAAANHQTRQKGGSTRRTRSSRNSYDKDYRRADWNIQPAQPSGPDRVPVLLAPGVTSLPTSPGQGRGGWRKARP